MSHIGSDLEKLRTAASRCKRNGGLPQLRTSYLGSLKPRKGEKPEVIFICYGKEKPELPKNLRGTMNIPKDIKEEIVLEDAKSGDELLEVLNIESEKDKLKKSVKQEEKLERKYAGE